MNYSQLKKLDEDTLQDLKESAGPVDECICNLLAPPDEPKGLRGSIKKVFASIGGRKPGAGAKGAFNAAGQNSVDIPLTFEKGGKGIYSTKEEVKRTTSCGKCSCDSEKIFLKHSYANIRITSPDVSSICPCPSSACMPGKDKLNNNISVTIEYVTVTDKEVEKYEENVDETENRISDEKTKPVMDKSSAQELVEHVWREWKNIEEWSGNIEEASEEAKTINNKPEYNHLATLNNSGSFDGTEEHEKIVLKKPNPEA